MSFEWDDRYTKGIARMDATHREFVELVNSLLQAPDEALANGLQQLLDHSRAHFAQELEWMHACDFPPLAIHDGEHQRVLGVLQQAQRFAADGEFTPVRSVIDSLPAWFEQHAATMDNALAMHMQHAGLEGAE